MTRTGYHVVVELGSVDSHVLAVLDVLEAYVNERRRLARVEPDGRAYMLHPD